MVFLANLAFNFHSGIYITTTFLLVNVYLMQNMIKNPIEIPFSLFFHNIGLTLAQIFRSEKKLVKPFKNCFLDPICTEKGSLWAMPKVEKSFFFGRNNKSRSSAFRKFLFYQNIICFD